MDDRKRLSIVIDQRVGDHLNRSGNDLIEFVQGQVDTMIGHTVFRKVVGSNSLASVAGTDQALSLVRSLLVLLLLKVIIELRFQNPHSFGKVLVLRAFLETFDNNAGFMVRDPNRRSGLVDVLTTGATAGGVAFDFIILRLEIDLNVLGFRQHRDGRSRCMDAALGFGIGHALDAVAATFVLQVRGNSLRLRSRW